MPAAIEGREEKHVTREELGQLLAWKLAVRNFPLGGRGLLPGRGVAVWAWAWLARGRALALWGGAPSEVQHP